MITTNLKIAIAVGFAVLWSGAVYFLPASQLILGLCGGALLISVLFFWNSLRTLGGDTDVPDEATRTVEHGPLEAMIARKKMLLLSLKDLDNERKLGKILPADFEDVSFRYREEVKSLMRQMDAAAEPYRARAEDLATKHLRDQGLMPRDDQKAVSDAERATRKQDSVEKAAATVLERDARADESDGDDDDDDDAPVDSRAITKPNTIPLAARPSRPPPAEEKAAETLLSTKKSLDIDPAKLEAGGSIGRRACPSCKASNEPDAKFCKECAAPLRGKTESLAAQKAEPEARALAATAEPAETLERDDADKTASKTEGATDA